MTAYILYSNTCLNVYCSGAYPVDMLYIVQCFRYVGHTAFRTEKNEI